MNGPDHGRRHAFGKSLALKIAANTILLSVALVSSSIACAADSASQSTALRVSSAILDGYRFRTQTFDRHGVARTEDRLVFNNGKFASDNCMRLGFGESPYWIRIEGDRVHFLSETTSPSHGTMVWKGTITGDRIEATYRWTKERWYWTLRREYQIRGHRIK